MKNREEEIKEILNALNKCSFYDLTEETFYEDIVEVFKEKYHKPFNHASGATKGVLIFNNFGFVIKIPFVGEYESEYDEDTNDYNSYVEYYEGADSEDGWDYCEVEVNRYEEALQYHVSNCFLKIEKIAEIRNYSIYIQPIATALDESDESNSTHTQDDIDKVCKICEDNYYDCFCSEWLGDAFNYYGEEVCKRLLDFLETEAIGDLHRGNIGYIGIQPVILDYADFNH